MNKAIVIRAAGDIQWGQAIAEGVAQVELQRAQQQLQRVSDQLGVRRECAAKETRKKIMKARRLYRFDRPSPITRALMIGWAMVYLEAREWYIFLRDRWEGRA